MWPPWVYRNYMGKYRNYMGKYWNYHPDIHWYTLHCHQQRFWWFCSHCCGKIATFLPTAEGPAVSFVPRPKFASFDGGRRKGDVLLDVVWKTLSKTRRKLGSLGNNKQKTAKWGPKRPKGQLSWLLTYNLLDSWVYGDIKMVTSIF